MNTSVLVLLLLYLYNAMSQCGPQPNLTTCYWYRSNACCSLAEDALFGEILDNVTTYNNENIADPEARDACNIRMSFLVCRPCAPANALPICTPLCASIAYRCGSDYASDLLATPWNNSISLMSQLDLNDPLNGACSSCSVCSSKNCWNFSSLTKATLITAILPILLMLL